MNELNKLVKQYEKENPGERATLDGLIFAKSFIEWQLATRPTCGKEQRKFLSIIEQESSYITGKRPRITFRNVNIPKEKFTELDLLKVIKGE